MDFSLTEFIRETYLQWIALVFAISFLIWGAMRIRAYFLEESDTTNDNHLLLHQFRELQTQGEVSEEEYRKLKSRVKFEPSKEADHEEDCREQ